MTDETPSNVPDATRLIAQLQARLLALGEDGDALPTAEIEKTAKAINALIVSLERADGFIQQKQSFRPGDRLSGPPRQVLLRKIKRMVENGVLNELDDE